MKAHWFCLRSTLLGLLVALLLAFGSAFYRLFPSMPAVRDLGLLTTLALPLASLALELAVLGGVPLGFALGLRVRKLRERLKLLVVPALVALSVLLVAPRIDVAPESPGAVVAQLIAAARSSCQSGAERVEVPLVRLELRCADGMLSGKAPIGNGTFTARDIEPSPDLSRLGFEKMQLEVPLGRSGTLLRVQAAEARVRGLRPWGRSREIPGPLRFVAAWLAVMLTCVTLALLLRERASWHRALVGGSGSVALVLVQLALDRGQASWVGALVSSLLGITGACLAAITLGLGDALILHWRSLRPRHRRRAIARAAGRW